MALGGLRTENRRRPGHRYVVFLSPIILPLFLSLLLSGCGLKLFSGGEAQISVHSVYSTHPGCSAFVAQTLRQGLTLIETSDAAYVPQRGDVFEGPARLGPSVFRMFDGVETRLREGGRNVSLNVVAKNLALVDAREQLNAACG